MREQRYDFIVVINHEYSKPIKWPCLTREEFELKKTQVNEEGLHLQVVASIKRKRYVISNKP